jgi:hypothetical protein
MIARSNDLVGSIFWLRAENQVAGQAKKSYYYIAVAAV